MTDYFVSANSFAAPFFSDSSEAYVPADSAAHALELFVRDYSHPCGLYSAACYSSADSMHKGEKPLARWLCNKEIAKQAATEGLSSYSYLSHADGSFRINDIWHECRDPQGGRIVP